MKKTYTVLGVEGVCLKGAIWAAVAGAQEPIPGKELRAVFRSGAAVSALFALKRAGRIEVIHRNGARCYMACNTPSGISVELLDKVFRARATAQR